MAGGAWNAGDPKTTIGDARWANYTVSSDVLFEATGSQYATIGAREQGGTANGQSVSAAELRVDPAGAWTFMRYGATLSSGSVAGTPAVAFKTGAGVWNNIAVKVAGNVYTALVNGVQVATYTDAAPQAAGRIQLGSSFNFVQFDNLKVETVPGYTPYYATIIDGMHQTSWADRSVPVLTIRCELEPRERPGHVRVAADGVEEHRQGRGDDVLVHRHRPRHHRHEQRRDDPRRHRRRCHRRGGRPDVRGGQREDDVHAPRTRGCRAHGRDQDRERRVDQRRRGGRDHGDRGLRRGGHRRRSPPRSTP